MNIPHKIILKSFEFDKILKKIKPDIVHSHGIRADMLNIKFKNKYISVNTIHNYALEDYPNLYGEFFGKILAYRHLSILRKISYPVACSYSIKNILKSMHNIDTIAIQNSADEAKYNNNNNNFNKNAIRKKLNLDEKDFYFIYVGKLIKRKNVLFLIKNFNKANLPDYVKLIVVGDGELKYECLKYANKNIIFMGQVSNVYEYLIASDIYISASISEGMPTSVLEAMACGLPLLLSDIPQHKEIISLDKRLGELFNLNSDDFIKKLRYMFLRDMEVDMKHMKNIIKDCFNKNFSSVRMTEKYQNLYNTIT